MKKAILSLLVFFISITLFSQNANTEKDKKDNMGQSISEVNAYYQHRIKEINSDPSLSKSEKKLKRKELKERKKYRIHEINGAEKNRKNEEKMKDNDNKDNGAKDKDKEKGTRKDDKDKGPKFKEKGKNE